MKKIQLEIGFTLIELVLVIFVGLIILIGFLSLYSWHTKVFRFQESSVLASEEARNIGHTLLDYTLQSRRVLASSTINSTVYISTTTSVVLEIPVFDASGNQVPNAYDNYVFYLSGQDLYLKNSVHASSSRKTLNKLLSNGVQNFSLTYDNANFSLVRKINANVGVMHTTRDGTQILSNFVQSLRLRNY